MPCAHSLQHSKVEHWSNLTHGALWKKHNLPSSKITTYWPFVLSFFWNDHLWSYQFTIFWGKASHSCSSKDTFENPLQDKRQWCSCSSRAPSVWKRETDLEGCFMSCSWNPAWEEGLCAGAAPAGALPPALCEHMDGEPGSRRGLGHAGGRACGSGPIAPPHTLSEHRLTWGACVPPAPLCSSCFPRTENSLQRRGGPLPSFICRSKLFTSCKHKHTGKPQSLWCAMWGLYYYSSVNLSTLRNSNCRRSVW